MDYADFLEECKGWTDSQWREYNNAYNKGLKHGIAIVIICVVCLLIIKQVFL